jgi:hypothetical protein
MDKANTRISASGVVLFFGETTQNCQRAPDLTCCSMITIFGQKVEDTEGNREEWSTEVLFCFTA